MIIKLLSAEAYCRGKRDERGEGERGKGEKGEREEGKTGKSLVFTQIGASSVLSHSVVRYGRVHCYLLQYWMSSLFDAQCVGKLWTYCKEGGREGGNLMPCLSVVELNSVSCSVEVEAGQSFSILPPTCSEQEKQFS